MRLHENGLNAALTASILRSRQDMRTLGFTERSGAAWGLHKRVGTSAILNISIPKDGGPFTLQIIDEINCDVYDYERELQINPENVFALGVQHDVDEVLAFLSRVRIIRGFKKGMPIFPQNISDIDVASYESV